MQRLMRLIGTGRVDPLPMTSHRFRSDEIEKAFPMMESKADAMIKPLITFD